MSQLPPAVQLLIVALVGGLAGGVAGRLSAPEREAKARSATTAEAEPADTSAIAKKVERLESAVATLERERRMTRAALARGMQLGDDGDTADAGAKPSAIDDPVFETAVRDILEQREDERREERRARMQERRKQAAERWSSWLGTEVGLSDAQKQKVAAIVQGYFEDMQSLRFSDGGELSWRDRREKAREARAKSEAKLGQVLDPRQLEKYNSLDDEQKIGFGFGGGRRRGGGGPRGPGGPGGP